jgi:hypothetical protein
MQPSERTKLNGIATGATANATDTQLRDRATHTGAQPVSSVTGLQTALDGKAPTAHQHGVTDLTATGTRDASTVLHGDNVWREPAGGGGGTSDAPSPLNVMWQTGPGQPLQPQTTRWATSEVPGPVIVSLYDDVSTLDPNPQLQPFDLVTVNGA